jgi:transcriptional regulator with XRE-family HTH domain
MDDNPRVARQVGAALRRLRTGRGLTQAQLAAAAGILPVELSIYERGKRLADLPTLRLLLAALEVSSGEFGRHLGPWGVAGPNVRITLSTGRVIRV